MKSETLTSVKNPKIKELVCLSERSKERRESGLFVVEGIREIGHCIDAGYRVRAIFHTPWADTGEIFGKLSSDTSYRTFEISDEIFSKLAYREDSGGMIAEIYARDHAISGLSVPQDALIVVLEGIEKPGNIGAILRSCDAAKADAIIICDPKCDLYNPNTIRASLGAAFTNRIAICDSSQAIKWLKARGIRILTAQLQDSKWYYDCDMRGPTAIVMGSEDKGLTQLWRENADRHIKIPMLGNLDSLNVSVSAAILIFEAVRQRAANIIQ